MIDIQNEADNRGIYLMNVGVSQYKLPITVNNQHTIATAKLGVSLSSSQRGIHMSRLCRLLETIDIVNNYTIQQILETAVREMPSDRSELLINTGIFVEKEAPISKIISKMYCDLFIRGNYSDGKISISHEIRIPITSLCPCSKAISKYGAHNQRGTIAVEFIDIDTGDYPSIIQLLEKAASSEIFEVLKRYDEKYVTEHAYENPKFVEDIVRDVILTCNNFFPKKLKSVETINEESIHSHNAFAATLL